MGTARTRGTTLASSGTRGASRCCGRAGRQTSTGSGGGRIRGLRLTKRCPSPSSCTAAGALPGTRRTTVLEPRTTRLPVVRGRGRPARESPSTTVPLVEPRSSTVTPACRTVTRAWRRDRSGSSMRIAASAPRPTTWSPGGSRCTCPQSGPPTTCSSSTPGTPERSRMPGSSSVSSAPASSGGLPTGWCPGTAVPLTNRAGDRPAYPLAAARAGARSAAVAPGGVRTTTSTGTPAPAGATTDSRISMAAPPRGGARGSGRSLALWLSSRPGTAVSTGFSSRSPRCPQADAPARRGPTLPPYPRSGQLPGSRPVPEGRSGGRDVDAVSTVEGEVRELIRRSGLDPARDAREVRQLVRDAVADYDERSLHGGLPALADLDAAVKSVLDAVAGLGPLQGYLEDPRVEEIWINAPGKVFVARDGVAELTTTILTAAEVRDLVERMLRTSGRRVDLSSPFVDATLADGSRLHVVIPDITREHWLVNIRKFVVKADHLDDLVRLGTLTRQAARFLEAAVVSGLNILVAGGTQAGKTTMLNCLAAAIPPRERVVTCEEVHVPNGGVGRAGSGRRFAPSDGPRTAAPGPHHFLRML